MSGFGCFFEKYSDIFDLCKIIGVGDVVFVDIMVSDCV
jgi:hypothetical protein